MELLWILTTIGLTSWIFKLQKRIKQLENFHPLEIQTNKSNLKCTNREAEIVNDGVDRSKWPTHLQNNPPKQNSPRTVQTNPSLPFDFENFLGQKLFPILGAVSIVVAISFFAVWAFANGWVGPMGRIAFGVIVSLALMGLGEYLQQKFPNFFTYLVSTGLAGLIITTLIAHYAYHFISALQCLGFLALQAGVGVLLALRYNSRILANFAISAGLLAPWFTSELDPMVVLPFVLILTMAGFVLALHKKWPEIFASLIVFASSYIFAATAQLNTQLLASDKDFNQALTYLGDAVINPFILLGFAAFIYFLIGSAGITRLIINQSLGEPPQEEVREIVLFTVSLLLFNLCASSVFYAQGWEHIGFLISAQALGFLALANWFKSQSWSHFHLITLSASLLFVIIATISELQSYEPLILTLALIFESVFMCAVGQLSKQKIYEWFGRATLVLALFHYIDNGLSEFGLNALLIFTFITAFLYSIGSYQKIAGKVWLGFSLLTSTSLLFDFSFNSVEIPHWLEGFLPTLWTLGLIYAAFYVSSFFIKVMAFLVFLFLSLAIMFQNPVIDWVYLATWLQIAVVGSALYFVTQPFKATNKIDAFMAYGSVSMLALTWILKTGNKLTEPWLTLSWLALIGVLMGLGLKFRTYIELRHIGLGLMLLVITRLYLVDIWQWDISVRVVAFAALGLALLGIGFFYQKKLWLKK